jgi:hemolysin activation/secretion protein
VADNGVTGSVEALISLGNAPQELQLTPFVEFGTAWNNRGSNPDPSTLASVGLGLRWLMAPSLQFRADYGIPLIPAEDQGNSLQSSGLYFSLTFEPTILFRVDE